MRSSPSCERRATELDDLVRAATSGGGWAFGRLWERLAPAVAGYARAHGVVEADDLTSEVFLAAFRRIGEFTGDGAAFRSWLFTIAHHRVVDDVRRRARRPADEPYAPESDRRSAASAEDSALERLGTAYVLDLVGRLVPDQRGVLLLRLVGDLTVDQVAAVLGKSPGAVKQLQRRGLRALARDAASRSPALPVPLEGPPSIAQVR